MASAPVWSEQASSLFLSRRVLGQLEVRFFLPCEEIPTFGPNNIHNRVEHVYVVTCALCVAFIDLRDLHDIIKHIHELQLTCWGVQPS